LRSCKISGNKKDVGKIDERALWQKSKVNADKIFLDTVQEAL
jgi:hypothetical protein